MSNKIEIRLPVGRLVGGHPITRNADKDNKTGQPKLDKLGQPQTSVFMYIAIAKGQEQDWKQTAWGQQIVQAAQLGWPGGQYNYPSFAWKIIDGDSAAPNKNGVAPNTREGYPGHWIINTSTTLVCKCYHRGRYDPSQQIQNEKEIKPGDYCRVVISAVGNGPDNQSPGVYLNPELFELYQAGIEIVLSSGPSAAEAFGSDPGQLPPGAQVDAGIAPPATGVVTPPVQGIQQAPMTAAPATPAAPPAQSIPAPQTPVKTMTAKAGGATYEQFIAQGWTDQQMVEQGYLLVTSPGVQPNAVPMG